MVGAAGEVCLSKAAAFQIFLENVSKRGSQGGFILVDAFDSPPSFFFLKGTIIDNLFLSVPFPI